MFLIAIFRHRLKHLSIARIGLSFPQSVSSLVHCLVQSGIWLAIGSSNVVQLIKQGTISLLPPKQVDELLL